ncbi:MAG: sensor domain-containing diguanylate cyclase [candidate division Zixibacteria bacterium]|nr:sensor domain-containing diguanylate cyclase [candidate division Zixibacteria bacterium]
MYNYLLQKNSWETYLGANNLFFFARSLLFLGLCIWLAFAPDSLSYTFYGWVLLIIFLSQLLGLYFYATKFKPNTTQFYSLTSLFDMIFITLLIVVTGGLKSDFYLLYYLSISLGAYHLGFGSGIFLAFLASFFYLLTNTPHLNEFFLGDLLIRISLFWVFAAGIGKLSSFLKSSEENLLKVFDTLNQRTTELEKSQVQIESIYEASRSLGEIYKLEQVIEKILEIAQKILRYQHFSILLLDKEKEVLMLKDKIEFGNKFKNTNPQQIPLSGITGSVLKEGKGVRIYDVKADPRYLPGLDGARSEMAVPMISQGKTIGVLNAESRKVGAFSEEDHKIFSILAGSAAMALENASLHQKMEELTIVDELTSIFNYRYFVQKLDDELKRARRYHQLLSLLMIDIDWFKKYNDNYGHLFGNLILKDLARVIKGCIRDVDILVRYGGEEFVVILPQTSKEDARNIGERIRSKVEQTQFKDKEEKLRVKLTVSLGVATYPENGTDPEELVKSVDRALYLAKGKGKNLICTV